MRPTGIGYRSPRERTPAYYTTYTDQKGKKLFSPQVESEQRNVQEFAKMRRGFGMTDRFLYVKMKERLAACQPNVSPADYNSHIQFKKLTQNPCNTVIRKLDIPASEQVNYKYVGQSLVYDPEKPMSQVLEKTRLALPGNRGVFTHPNMRARTLNNSIVGRRSGGKGGEVTRYQLAAASSESQTSQKQDDATALAASHEDQQHQEVSSEHPGTELQASLQQQSTVRSAKDEAVNQPPNLSCQHTELTERAHMTESQKIIKETDCECAMFPSGSRASKQYENSANALSSFRQAPEYQTPGRITSGKGIRTLPRLSASQAVNNFRDIYSEKERNPQKYRHISQADFHPSMDAKKKKFLDGETLQQNIMVASSDGICSNDPGFSTITPINPSDKRKVAMAQFESNKGGAPSGTVELASKQNMRVTQSIDHTQKTTVRSRAASSTHSRKSASYRSLRSRQRQSRASDMQTNDFYVLGSQESIKVNYRIDKMRQTVEHKPGF